MVLSNKKLKQKIRSLLVESVAAAESRDAAKAEDAKQQLQGLKDFLSARNHSGERPTRRGGKRRKPSSSADDVGPADAGTEERERAGDVGGCVDLDVRKKKKRKRGEGRESDGAAESTVQKQGKQKRVKVEDGGKKKMEKKKKKKKQKKGKKEKESKGDGETVKNGNESGRSSGGGNEEVEAEAAVINTCCSVENSDAIKKVYVGGIPYYSAEDDIRSFFESCGTITEVDCMCFPESGKFRGIAIVTFKTEAAAKRALALDGADMGGLFLKIQPYKATRTQKADFSPQVIDGYYRIYAGNLSWDIAEEDLRKLFSDCKIACIRFGEDKATGEFKGYAHVDFEDNQSHAVALELDQKVVCGRPVRIRCAVPKKGAETKQTPKPAASQGDDGGAGGGDAKSKGDVDGCAGSGGGQKKKKRQTCYVCGVPGHLSSTCRQRKADGGGGANAASAVAESKSDVDGFAGSESGKKKKKRQTCYVCGVSGHLSSSCPQNKA
ncbi:hypothetical protein Taro_055517 [Colocasia esculenta]|uniref:Protein gar2 n=1 Tax=Colocasia esculenta TaxID=4460 RepID=A0A843XUG3_COLES|nr:hypothetical protein [Colocasia esculenta]